MVMVIIELHVDDPNTPVTSYNRECYPSVRTEYKGMVSDIVRDRRT